MLFRSALLQDPTIFTKPFTGVKSKERHKLVFYGDHPKTYTLVAFAVGCQTELGDNALVFMDKIAVQLATQRLDGQQPAHRDIVRASRHIRQRIGCSVMRVNAEAILDALKQGGGRPGLTAANRAKHSDWKKGEGVSPARGW